MATVHREFDGVRIEGERYSIWIHPLTEWRTEGDATLSIGVDAQIDMSRPGRDGWARMTYDMRHEFTSAEVELATTAAGADELRCLRVDSASAPAYRTGFALALEAGMRPFIETELPRVERVTRLAGALRRAVEPHLARPLPEYGWTTVQPHEASAIAAIAARAVLDDYAPADAIRWAVLRRSNPMQWAFADEAGADDLAYAELGAALRQPDVTALLEANRGVTA
jgi:hypothetical protein